MSVKRSSFTFTAKMLQWNQTWTFKIVTLFAMAFCQSDRSGTFHISEVQRPHIHSENVANGKLLITWSKFECEQRRLLWFWNDPRAQPGVAVSLFKGIFKVPNIFAMSAELFFQTSTAIWLTKVNCKEHFYFEGSIAVKTVVLPYTCYQWFTKGNDFLIGLTKLQRNSSLPSSFSTVINFKFYLLLLAKK